MRDAEGRSAGLPLTLNIPPCLHQKKKKGRASVKVSTSHKVKTRFTWESQSVPCNPILPTHEEKVVRNIKNSI